MAERRRIERRASALRLLASFERAGCGKRAAENIRKRIEGGAWVHAEQVEEDMAADPASERADGVAEVNVARSANPDSPETLKRRMRSAPPAPDVTAKTRIVTLNALARALEAKSRRPREAQLLNRANSWRWLEAPQILFHSKAPTCDGCGKPIIWLGPPTRKLGMFVYEIRCWCPNYDEHGLGANHTYDRIVSPFPLRMGGTTQWWEEVHGTTAP